MRIGPDGMPQPWAAESVSWVDDKTVDVKLRAGMKWHDGKPVTVEDVIFSFEAPAGDKAPMYKPFVTDIAAIEKTGDLSLRFKLKQANATFLTASLAKINLIPKHIWEPVLKDLAGKPENAEQLKEVSAISARDPSRWCAGSPPRRSCSSATAIISRRPRSSAGSCASCPMPRRRSAC